MLSGLSRIGAYSVTLTMSHEAFTPIVTLLRMKHIQRLKGAAVSGSFIPYKIGEEVIGSPPSRIR